MGRYTYPHVIENGAGERITFIRVVQGPKGDRLEVENIVFPILVALGTLLGRYRRYADAPQPVRR